MSLKDGAETAIRDIRRKTRKQYSAEEKIRIVLSGLRGEDSIAELCRREGIAESLYYSWSKEFLEAEISLELKGQCRRLDVRTDQERPNAVFLSELYDDAAAFVRRPDPAPTRGVEPSEA